jgi:hypothetical protein
MRGAARNTQEAGAARQTLPLYVTPTTKKAARWPPFLVPE